MITPEKLKEAINLLKPSLEEQLDDVINQLLDLEDVLREIASEVRILEKLDDPKMRSHVARKTLNKIDYNLEGGL